jgi:hypothetical protein
MVSKQPQAGWLGRGRVLRASMETSSHGGNGSAWMCCLDVQSRCAAGGEGELA